MVLQSLALAALMATSSPDTSEIPDFVAGAVVSDSTMFYRRYFAAPPVPPGGLGPAVGESTDTCVTVGVPEPTIVTNTTGTVTPYYFETIIGFCPGGLI